MDEFCPTGKLSVALVAGNPTGEPKPFVCGELASKYKLNDAGA